MSQPRLSARGSPQNNLKTIRSRSRTIAHRRHRRLRVRQVVAGVDTLFAEGSGGTSSRSRPTRGCSRRDRPARRGPHRADPPCVALRRRRTRCARRAPPSAPRPRSTTTPAAVREGRPRALRVVRGPRQPLGGDHRETLLADNAGARGPRHLPLPVPRPACRRPRSGRPSRAAAFARVRLRRRGRDLAAPPARRARRAGGRVVLDRVVLAVDGRARSDSLETALREGGGASRWRSSGARRASPRSSAAGVRPPWSGPSHSCSRSTTRSAPARSARASATSSSTRVARRPRTAPSASARARSSRGRTRRQVYQRELGKAAKRAGWAGHAWERWSAAPSSSTTATASSPGINGFFRRSSLPLKLHVRVFLSRYRTQSPCRVRGRAAQARRSP